MYLNAKENAWKAAMYQLRDLKTNEIIPHVLWADDENGIYGQYVFDDCGFMKYDENNNPVVKIVISKIRLEVK